MSEWSLKQLLESLHEDIQGKLEVARKSFAHSGSKGSASESIWLEFLGKYLPRRYEVKSAFVVDSEGQFSDQLDLVIYDRQYSPFIFRFENQDIIPAESVYAVFEAKQELGLENIRYARDKIASVRRLHRTSLAIPHAGGQFAPKPPPWILGGVLTLESSWSDPLGQSLHRALAAEAGVQRLDLGCVAASGIFLCRADGEYEARSERKPATAFLFELIARLQEAATVPMIDIRAYAKWLL